MSVYADKTFEKELKMIDKLGFQVLNTGLDPEYVVVIINDGKHLIEYGPGFTEPWTKDAINVILNDLRFAKGDYFDPVLHWHLLTETENGVYESPYISSPDFANIMANYGKVMRDILNQNNINENIIKPEDIDKKCIGKLSLCFFDINSTPMIVETVSVEVGTSNEKKLKLYFPEQTIYDTEKEEYIEFGPSENDVIITKDKNNEYNVSWIYEDSSD
jgi:hypothetical protein